MSKSRFSVAVKSLLIPTLLISLAACSAIEGQESAGDYMDDATITAKVKAAFIADPQVKAFQVNVETMEGVVQLSGFVDTAENENRAVHLAEQVKGVKVVKDSLVVTPKPAS